MRENTGRFVGPGLVTFGSGLDDIFVVVPFVAVVFGVGWIALLNLFNEVDGVEGVAGEGGVGRLGLGFEPLVLAA
jgi:hypothetical protein